jgi:TubC N-terminal docking domain
VLVGELLRLVAEHGAELRRGEAEDSLQFAPPGALPPELVVELKEHKVEIIRILREDEEMHHTGIIQSERQVFEVARKHFGLGSERGAT